MNANDDDQSFSPETLREWEAIVDEVNELFGTLGTEDEDFEVSTECSTGFTIDLLIKNYERIRHEDVMRLAPEVRVGLRDKRSYWCVRIHVFKPDAMPGRDAHCIWLEIDRYRVLPWRGKQERELYGDIGELYRTYWK
jgi:hypothetical protein